MHYAAIAFDFIQQTLQAATEWIDSSKTQNDHYGEGKTWKNDSCKNIHDFPNASRVQAKRPQVIEKKTNSRNDQRKHVFDFSITEDNSPSELQKKSSKTIKRDTRPEMMKSALDGANPTICP